MRTRPTARVVCGGRAHRLPACPAFDDNRLTLKSRIIYVSFVGSLAGCAGGVLAMLASRSWPLTLLGAALVGALFVGGGLWFGVRELARIQAALVRFAQGNFSPLRQHKFSPWGSLVPHFNTLGDILKEKQASLEQSELLLHTLIDAAPMAILLFEDIGQIEYSNDAARTLFFEGRSVEGSNFLSMLADAPAPFREAVLCDQDRLFSVNVEGATETYHVSKRHFELHGGTHTLLMVKHLTRELRKQEIDIWKKLVRVVSHELNNSLAPIKSLVHSARIMTHADQNPKLDRVFATIDERASHLQGFVEGYARFARLPTPRKERVALCEFLGHLGTLVPFARIVSPPADGVGHFDRSQLEQVIINLLKNAREAGGPEDAVSLTTGVRDGEVTFVVEDRGPGMSPEVLESAMLPFFSTKDGGSGLGLAICREIVEAHGGAIRLENREGGGLVVTCSLPGPNPKPSPKARLTLSRVTTGAGVGRG